MLRRIGFANTVFFIKKKKKNDFSPAPRVAIPNFRFSPVPAFTRAGSDPPTITRPSADRAGHRPVARHHGGQLPAVDRGRPQLGHGAARVRVGRRAGQRDRVQRQLRPFVQSARAVGQVRPPGRDAHGAGPGGRGGHDGGRRPGPAPAAVRHVPVVVRHAVRAGARRRRVHVRAARHHDRPQTVQDDHAGRRPRVAGVLPRGRVHRDTRLERQHAILPGQLQVGHNARRTAKVLGFFFFDERCTAGRRWFSDRLVLRVPPPNRREKKRKSATLRLR